MIKKALFIITVLICLYIGGFVAQAVITGLLLLAGLIFLTESIKPLKWLVYKLIPILDIIAFAFGIYAMFAFGFIMALGVSIAGLGITMLYRPYIQAIKTIRKNK
jgi:hypothetical protein